MVKTVIMLGRRLMVLFGSWSGGESLSGVLVLYAGGPGDLSLECVGSSPNGVSRTGVVVSEGTGDSTGVVATDNGFSGGSTSICSDSGDPGSSVSSVSSGSGDIERS